MRVQLDSLAALPVVKSQRYTSSRRLGWPQCLLRREKSLVSDYFHLIFFICVLQIGLNFAGVITFVVLVVAHIIRRER